MKSTLIVMPFHQIHDIQLCLRSGFVTNLIDSFALSGLKKLIRLYQNDVQIDKDKLAESPSFTDNLLAEDWVEGSGFKRPVRYARLLTSDHLIPADIIPPLFEPHIIKMTTSQMTLHAYLLISRDRNRLLDELIAAR